MALWALKFCGNNQVLIHNLMVFFSYLMHLMKQGSPFCRLLFFHFGEFCTRKRRRRGDCMQSAGLSNFYRFDLVDNVAANIVGYMIISKYFSRLFLLSKRLLLRYLKSGADSTENYRISMMKRRVDWGGLSRIMIRFLNKDLKRFFSVSMRNTKKKQKTNDLHIYLDRIARLCSPRPE